MSVSSPQMSSWRNLGLHHSAPLLEPHTHIFEEPKCPITIFLANRVSFTIPFLFALFWIFNINDTDPIANDSWLKNLQLSIAIKCWTTKILFIKKIIVSVYEATYQIKDLVSVLKIGPVSTCN